MYARHKAAEAMIQKDPITKKTPAQRKSRRTVRQVESARNKLSVQTRQPASLLSIPVELRLEIYKHLLTDVNHKSLTSRRWLYGNILRVCKVLRFEAYHFLCTNNKWLRITFYHDTFTDMIDDMRRSFLPMQPLLQHRVYIPEAGLPSEIVSVLDKMVDVEFQVPKGGCNPRVATIPKSVFVPYDEVVWADICKAITTEIVPMERYGDDKINIAPGARCIIENNSLLDYRMLLPLALIDSERAIVLLDQYQPIHELKESKYSFMSRLDQAYHIQEIMCALAEVGTAYRSAANLPAAIAYYKFGIDFAKHYELEPCNEFSRHGTPLCNALIGCRNHLIIRQLSATNDYLKELQMKDYLAFAEMAFDLLDNALCCGELIRGTPASSDKHRYQYHSHRVDSLKLMQSIVCKPPIGFDLKSLCAKKPMMFGGSEFHRYCQLILAEAKDSRWASILAEGQDDIQYWRTRFEDLSLQLGLEPSIFEKMNPTFRRNLTHRTKEWQHDAEMVSCWMATITGVEEHFAAGEHSIDLRVTSVEDVQKLAKSLGLSGKVNVALARLLL